MFAGLCCCVVLIHACVCVYIPMRVCVFVCLCIYPVMTRVYLSHAFYNTLSKDARFLQYAALF